MKPSQSFSGSWLMALCTCHLRMGRKVNVTLSQEVGDTEDSEHPAGVE